MWIAVKIPIWIVFMILLFAYIGIKSLKRP